MIGTEILALSQSQTLLLQSLLTRFSALESTLVASPRYAAKASPKTADPGSSVANLSTCSTQPLSQQQCSRYCKCQCHRITSIRTPPWMRTLAGSLRADYNGSIWSRKEACDDPTCRRRESSRTIRLAYAFPGWLLGRAVFLSGSWGSLTNAGASLHLAVPRVNEPSWVIHAMNKCLTEFLRKRIANREIMPTDIGEDGEGYLVVSRPTLDPSSSCQGANVQHYCLPMSGLIVGNSTLCESVCINSQHFFSTLDSLPRLLTLRDCSYHTVLMPRSK